MWVTFLQITQKIATKDSFHCLVLITEILSFLQIFSVRKTTTQLFLYLGNSARISTKKVIFLTYFGPLKANITNVTTYTALFFPDSNNCFFPYV